MSSLREKESRFANELREDFVYFTGEYSRLAEILGVNLEPGLVYLGARKSFENCQRLFLAYNVHLDLQIVPPYNSGPYAPDRDYSKLDKPNECEFATIVTKLWVILEKLEKHSKEFSDRFNSPFQ